jgi:hypothetical protein
MYMQQGHIQCLAESCSGGFTLHGSAAVHLFARAARATLNVLQPGLLFMADGASGMSCPQYQHLDKTVV